MNFVFKKLLYIIKLNVYKLYIYIETFLFKGPSPSLSFVSSNLDIPEDPDEPFVDENISNLSLSLLINRGVWYFYNFGYWIGNRILNLITPRLQILNNLTILTSNSIYNRKIFERRLLYMHNMFYQRLLFVRCVLVLPVVLFVSLFLWFNIFLAFYLLPVLFVIYFKCYQIFIKLFRVTLSKLFYKPVAFEQKDDSFEGDLNYPIFFGNNKFFFKIRKLFFKKYDYHLPFKYINTIKKKICTSLVVNKIFNFCNNSNFSLNVFQKMKNFWVITQRYSKVTNDFFYDFSIKRVIYRIENRNSILTRFIRFLLKIYFYGRIGLFEPMVLNHLNFLKLIIVNPNFFEYFLFHLKSNFVYFFIYNFVLFYFNISLFINLFLLVIFGGYLYFEYLIICKNYFKHTLIYQFLINDDDDKDLQILRMGGLLYTKSQMVRGFNVNKYKKILRYELNGFKCESFINGVSLDQESIYRLIGFVYTNETTLSDYLNALLLKYKVIFDCRHLNRDEKNLSKGIKGFINFDNKNLLKKDMRINSSFTLFNLLKKKRSKVTKGMSDYFVKRITYLSTEILEFNSKILSENKLKKLTIKELELYDSEFYYKYGIKLFK